MAAEDRHDREAARARIFDSAQTLADALVDGDGSERWEPLRDVILAGLQAGGLRHAADGAAVRTASGELAAAALDVRRRVADTDDGTRGDPPRHAINPRDPGLGPWSRPIHARRRPAARGGVRTPHRGGSRGGDPVQRRPTCRLRRHLPCAVPRARSQLTGPGRCAAAVPALLPSAMPTRPLPLGPRVPGAPAPPGQPDRAAAGPDQRRAGTGHLLAHDDPPRQRRRPSKLTRRDRRRPRRPCHLRARRSPPSPSAIGTVASTIEPLHDVAADAHELAWREEGRCAGRRPLRGRNGDGPARRTRSLRSVTSCGARASSSTAWTMTSTARKRERGQPRAARAWTRGARRARALTRATSAAGSTMAGRVCSVGLRSRRDRRTYPDLPLRIVEAGRTVRRTPCRSRVDDRECLSLYMARSARSSSSWSPRRVRS